MKRTRVCVPVPKNYWCVNSKASEANIQATLDFLQWVVESDAGKNGLAKEMGFVTPSLPLQKNTCRPTAVAAADEYVKNGTVSVTWNFTTMPSEEWKNQLGVPCWNMLRYRETGMQWLPHCRRLGYRVSGSQQ